MEIRVNTREDTFEVTTSQDEETESSSDNCNEQFNDI